MNFSDRFELLEPLREGEVQTLRARERATGRAVEVHFFVSAGLLAKLEPGLEVIDRGSQDGRFYVVIAPSSQPAALDSAGAWRIKPAAPSALAQQESAPVPPGPISEPGVAPGDFTRMFQLRQAPEPLAAPASKSTHPEPSVVSQPGAFTRAFQKPAMASSPPLAAVSDPGQPGEFTRMFQKPAVPKPPAPASQPEGGGAAAPPARLPMKLIVIAAAVLFAIAVFVVVRKLY